MAQDVAVRGKTGLQQDVDSEGNASVRTSLIPANIGGIRTYSENDPGTIIGSPTLKSPEVSTDFRMRVGIDTVLFYDTFNATAQNTSLWNCAFATMTLAQSAGFLNINAAGTSTVSGNYAYMRSWRHFPLIGTAPLAVEMTGSISTAPIVNEVMQMGLGIPTGAAECVDGCWFELTTAGLKGCARYNGGTTTKIDLIPVGSVTPDKDFKYVLVVGESAIEFWASDVLLGVMPVPVGQGQPFITTALPVFMQKYNSGVVGISPNLIMRIGDVTVSLMDLATNKTWAGQMASSGLGMQGLDGGTMGSPQVQWSNTALPTAAAGTNSTAALGACLGGIFQATAPATSASDIIIASYQNPAGGANQTPRTIMMRGIKVDMVNAGAAVATTPTTLALALAWGGTTVSLGTAETGSFVTATAKNRRVQPIGVLTLPVGAAIGAAASTPAQFDFEAPIVINPGEFVQVIGKILCGTATASQVLQFVVSPNLYHE